MKYKLVKVEWDDAYSSSPWHNMDEINEDFFETNKFQCVNVGYLIKQNKECVILAARIAEPSEQFGLIERLPRKMIKKITYLSA